MAASSFVEQLAASGKAGAGSSGGGPRLLTPEAPGCSWCAVARPFLLSARVTPAGAAVGAGAGAARAGLRPLLPLIFEKLLGRPLDAAPWGLPVLRSQACTSCEEQGEEEAEVDRGELSVCVALHAPPPAQEGLFEVGTPVGLVTLRLQGLRDSAGPRADDLELPACLQSDSIEEDPVLVLTLPSEWFGRGLLNRAWGRRTLDLFECAKAQQLEEGQEDEEEVVRLADGTDWRAWLGQWGEVQRLELAAHASGLGRHSSQNEQEGGAETLLCVTFAGDSAASRRDTCSRCLAALDDGRLLVLKDPPRAIFAQVQCMPREDFDARVELGFQEHLAFEEEITRVDSALVLDELVDAVPSGMDACFAPLIGLLRLWIEQGVLHASSTICAQRRIQEMEAGSRGKAPALFRRACWSAALRLVLQIRPRSTLAGEGEDDDLETTGLALCEHWRKAHGVFVEVDRQALAELAEALRGVWQLMSVAEAALRRTAEAEATSAERELLEELEADESKAARDRKKREKKREKEKDKERQRRQERAFSGSSSAGLATADGEADGGEVLAPVSPSPISPSLSSPGKQDSPGKDVSKKAKRGAPKSRPAAHQEATSYEESIAEVRVESRGEISAPQPPDVMFQEDARRLLLSLYGRHASAVLPAPRGSDSPGTKRTQKKKATSTKMATPSVSAPKPAEDPVSPLKRDADIEHILDAVRKSEELHHAKVSTPAAVCSQASALLGAADSSTAIIDDKRTLKAKKVKSQEPQASTTASEDGASLSETASSPDHHTPRQHSKTTCESPEPEVLKPEEASLEVDPSCPRDVVTWGDLGDVFLMRKAEARTTSAPPSGSPELPLTETSATVPLVPDSVPPEVTRAAWADMSIGAEECSNPEDLSLPRMPVPEESDLSLPLSPGSPGKSSRRAGRRRRRSGGSSAESNSIAGTGEPSPKTVYAEVQPSSVAEVHGGRASNAPAARRNVVTLSDLGFNLAPAPPAVPEPPTAISATPTAAWAASTPPACWATSPCSPGATCTTPIMRTGPCMWYPGSPAEGSQRGLEASQRSPQWGSGRTLEASQRSPQWATGSTVEASQLTASRTPTASTPGCADHGDAFRSWLQASGLPPTGAELAEKLRVVAPEAYED